MAGFWTRRLNAVMLLLISVQVYALQADLEALVQAQADDSGERDINLERIGLSLKKTISDESGDRLKLFLRLEAEDDFRETGVEQLYAKYKGPMGRWNLSVGRMAVPFGLLTEYDTEWQIVKAQEDRTIGFKYDDGVMLNGFVGPIDYALFVSQGEGIESGSSKSHGMATVRVSYKGLDYEDLDIGLSVLHNRITGIEKSIVGVDLIKNTGPLTLRGELVMGKEDGRELRSLFGNMDYGFKPSWNLNFAFNYLRSGIKEESVTLGVTFRSPFFGLIFRAGDRYHFDGFLGEKNEIFLQAYTIFSGFF